MKKTHAVGCLAACLALIVFLPRKTRDEASRPSSLEPSPRPVAAGAGRKAETSRGSARPRPDSAAREEAAAAIQDAVIRYSPEGVKTILPYLSDPDPAIRRAARDGLVQLGEVDAIPHLRAAAARVDDPVESASLRDAADLLALPAWSDSEEARDAVEEIIGGTSK